MVGMIQILTYLLAFYLIVKGVEILQLGLASNRENRGTLIAIGSLSLIACIAAAAAFVYLQDRQAASIGNNMAKLSSSASGSADAEAAAPIDSEDAATQAAIDATNRATEAANSDTNQ